MKWKISYDSCAMEPIEGSAAALSIEVTDRTSKIARPDSDPAFAFLSSVNVTGSAR